MSRLTTLEGYVQKNYRKNLNACERMEIHKAFRSRLKEVSLKRFSEAICDYVCCDRCALDTYTAFEEVLACLD